MKNHSGKYLTETDLLDLGAARCGTHVRIHETTSLIDIERMEFGSHVRIDPFGVISAAGGSLKIGSYVHIASHCVIMAGAGIEMRDFSGLSSGVKIYSVSDDYSGASLTNPTVPRHLLKTKAKPVVLNRHVIVGAGSVILPGVTIGEGAAVGAISMVQDTLGEWGIYAGSPALRLKERKRDLLNDEAAAIQHLQNTTNSR